MLKKLTLLLAVKSVFSLLIDVMSSLMLFTATRENDITVWFFGIMASEMELDITVLIFLTYLGTIISLVFFFAILWNYFKLKIGSKFFKFLYLFPMIRLKLIRIFYYDIINSIQITAAVYHIYLIILVFICTFLHHKFNTN